MGPIADRLKRPLRDLRISVTDRCNLRCGYCMPREVFGRDFVFLDRSQLLSFEEIERLARISAKEGVRKIRLTGGEPLLRADLPRLVAMLARIEGIEDLALTTNGTALGAHACALAEAGLHRVTVSLDALEQDAFESMSDTRLPVGRVLAGIDAAHVAGLRPVKVNMVVRRGVNDHCVQEMAEHFRGRPEELRFIEYMDVGESNGWRLEQVVPASEILASIDARWPLRELPPRRAGEVASRWAYRDGAGEIGVIHSVTEPFCSGCTRVRLSADGQLYTCLFARRGHDLRAQLRGGASDEQLAERLRGVWTARADRYSEQRASPTHPREGARVEMSYIGG
jgi:cyclic pyranopterin phosphate synthase